MNLKGLTFQQAEEATSKKLAENWPARDFYHAGRLAKTAQAAENPSSKTAERARGGKNVNFQSVRRSGRADARDSIAVWPGKRRVVNALGEGKGSDALDLAGDKLLDLPQDFNNWPVPKQEQWLKENNIDLLVEFEQVQAFGGPAGTSARIAAEGTNARGDCEKAMGKRDTRRNAVGYSAGYSRRDF